MCRTCYTRNPFHCIVPPFMVEKIAEASESRRGIFVSSVNTQFNDELFRTKRTLLTEMNAKQMKAVLTSSLTSLVGKMVLDEKRTKAAVKKSLGPVRNIYDAGNNDDQRLLPGKLVRKEGQRPVADKDVNNIYDHNGHTWDFFHSKFGRNSIDGNGLPLVSSVHFGAKFGNAFWEGTQMVYGDGDAVFKSFTNDIDITAHELTHGIVQYEASLNYENQSGAINESMADIFGIMVRQYALNEDAQSSNWLIGSNTIKGSGYALRSLKAPGTAYQNHPILGDDPQPAHMSNYQNLPNNRRGDYGGVHINSGIPNHAFYLTAIALGGYSWEAAGKVWYAALCDKTLLNSTSQFSDLAHATIMKGESIYGIGSKEAQAIRNAWQSVGL